MVPPMSRSWPRLWLLAVVLVGCTVPVQHGLDESSANEVLTALERGGIGAEKLKDDGAGGAAFLVRVARSDAAAAMELLHTLGLPRGHRSGFAEVYGQPSLVPSATEERARYLEALAGELERTLETVEGVISARVHLVPGETDALSPDGRPRVPAQAAVLLKIRSGVSPLKEADVQKLVAGSVPGLAPAAVAVVVTLASEWSGATAASALATVGPLRVSAASRPVLVAGVIIALGLVAVLAVLLLLMSRRLSALQRDQR